MVKISLELKKLVVDSHRKGKSAVEIAKMFDINVNSVRTIVFRFLKNKKLELPRAHRPKILSSEMVAKLDDWLEGDCQLTYENLVDRLKNEFDVDVSVSTVRRSLVGLRYSFKRVSIVPERRNSSQQIEARYQYAMKFIQLDQDPDKLFFLDETGIQVHARLNYGHAKKGQKANVKVKAVRGKNLSVCAAINHLSLFYYEVKEEAYDTIAFVDYLRSFLQHLEHQSITGANLVMDNVRFHHAEQVEQIVSQAGHNLIFLPAYSPFLNPIEELFNQLKFYVKRLKPETVDAVFESVSLASEVIDENDCRNYYKHMKTYILKCLNRDEILN